MLFRCNFKCSYCIQTNHETTETEEAEYKRLLNQAKHIKRLCEADTEQDYFNLYLIGGEISVIKLDKFLSILEALATTRIHHIYIISNFSQPLSWYKTVGKQCEKLGLKLRYTFSYHYEFFKYEVFKKKLYEFLYSKPKSVEMKVELCISHNNYSMAEQFKKELEKNFELQWDYNRLEEWTENEKSKYLSTDNRQLFENTIDTYGCTCSNSTYQSYVFPDGMVYGVTCTPTRHPLGLINMMKTWVKKTIICKNHKCHACGKLFIVKNNNGEILFNNIKQKTEEIR